MIQKIHRWIAGNQVLHQWFWPLLIYADRLGIGFPYQGDELIWIWPWRRRARLKWLSVNCEGTFQSLVAYRRFWTDYEAACQARFEADAYWCEAHGVKIGDPRPEEFFNREH